LATLRAPARPVELTLEVVPQARLDVIDVRDRAAAVHGATLDRYPRCLYCSYHTTAGYLPQSLAARLSGLTHGVTSYIDLFRTLFPEGAGYRHDDMDQRTELTHEQRPLEPTNADSHLAFMAGGLHSVVSYSSNGSPQPVYLIDLDGVYAGRARRRTTTLVGYTREIEVARTTLQVPVSPHPIDAVNLKDNRLGLYPELQEFLSRYDVSKGRLRLDLGRGEQHASLTINEYETLLMRHDLAEVLRNPLRFATEKARNAWTQPHSVPQKTLDYAKYDFVQTLNRVVDMLGLGQSRIERLMAKAMGVPASRFLRMKRSVSLLVSDSRTPGQPGLVEGTYQSPILIQWRGAPSGTRTVDVSLTRFV
jgi:thiamine phosphate synthase YjbQ (UPF0047 family)